MSPQGWRSVCLGELASIVTGATPKAAEADSWGEYLDFVTPSDQLEGHREAVPVRRLSKIGAERLKRRIVPPLSTNLTCIGSTIGKVSMAATECVTNQQINSLVAREQVADPRFIYYMILGWSPELKRFAAGSATPIVNKSDLSEFRFSVPNLPVQRAIAEVLGALDDKIAANRRLVEASDELVRAWFDMCKCAPQVKPVSELVSNVRSTVAPKNMNRNRIYLGLEHLPRRNLWVAEYGNTSEVQSAKSEFCDGDILFGKLRPYFHKVCTAPSAGLCSTDILVLRPQSPDIAGYALAALASDEVIEKVTAASEGTRMPRTSWKDLGAITVPWPGNDEARRISQRIDGVRSASLCAVRESRMLAAIRDALLPRLMSGELRVREAEDVVSQAV